MPVCVAGRAGRVVAGVGHQARCGGRAQHRRSGGGLCRGGLEFGRRRARGLPSQPLDAARDRQRKNGGGGAAP